MARKYGLLLHRPHLPPQPSLQVIRHKIHKNMFDPIMPRIDHRHPLRHGVDPLVVPDIACDIDIRPAFYGLL